MENSGTVQLGMQNNSVDGDGNNVSAGVSFGGSGGGGGGGGAARGRRTGDVQDGYPCPVPGCPKPPYSSHAKMKNHLIKMAAKGGDQRVQIWEKTPDERNHYEFQIRTGVEHEERMKKLFEEKWGFFKWGKYEWMSEER